ncbi:methionine adenosyltransferase [Anopheles sinensis]|uniref:Methionine adenosyltransferase n=1 Tax=Anopheles sinensis TaxID=74873 RepID=A0A084WCG9_ANOSI|nr:methionine adenosyltransferase [Anopheles sinensis]
MKRTPGRKNDLRVVSRRTGHPQSLAGGTGWAMNYLLSTETMLRCARVSHGAKVAVNMATTVTGRSVVEDFTPNTTSRTFSQGCNGFAG